MLVSHADRVYNDGIGMVYSGHGSTVWKNDFRLVTDTSLLLLLLLLIPLSVVSCHYPSLLSNTVCMYSLCLFLKCF